MAIAIASLALYVLFRLGSVAVEVVRRHRANAAIASFEGTLVPSVDAFVAGYTTVSTLKARLAVLLEASASATAALYKGTSAWLGPIGRDLPGFDGRGFGVDPTVDEDVLADARRLLDLVQADGQSLPYAAALIEEISRLATATQVAHAAAQEVRVALQMQQGQTRSLGVKLQRELVALRRTLRAELGTHHVDYQRLRAPRARMAVEASIEGSDAPVITPSLPRSVPQPVPSASTPPVPSNGRSSVV